MGLFGNDDLEQRVARGNKIEAIKLAREKYSLGLKEAKDYVDRCPTYADHGCDRGASVTEQSLSLGPRNY
jgi:ribosomal protein L7/L12